MSGEDFYKSYSSVEGVDRSRAYAMLFAFAPIFGALIGIAGLHNGRPPTDVWQLGPETPCALESVVAWSPVSAMPRLSCFSSQVQRFPGSSSYSRSGCSW